MRWFTALSLALLSPLVVHAYANDIENPSAYVLKTNQNVLNRVVQLSSLKAQCSGTWLEKGIILTAAHCLELTKQPSFKVQNIAVSVLGIEQRASIVADGSVAADAELFGSLQDSYDYGLILIDPRPLASLNLPDDSIDMVAADASGMPAGTELLISGYGSQENRPQTRKTEAGKKTAALIRTIAPTQDDVYSIISSARRNFQITATIPRGKTSHETHFAIDFKGKRRDGSMIMAGDSGGPAFIKENGRWVLVGIASLIRMFPDPGRQFSMSMSYGKRIYKRDVAFGSTTIDGDFQDFFLQMMKRYNQDTFQVEWTQPVTETLIYRQSAEGEVRSYHVSLKDPMIRVLINRSLSKLRSKRLTSESGLQ